MGRRNKRQRSYMSKRDKGRANNTDEKFSYSRNRDPYPHSGANMNPVTITPKTIGQRDYLNSIRKNKLTVCTGPAGTGKTIIAAAMAINYVVDGIYDQIVIVRPAVTACNEKIGFLPGGIDDKMGPFMMPLLYNMEKLMKPEEFRTFSRCKVKIIPMAFMRGITLDNCVVILDEAQNTKPDQMKMFLTRFGENCKAIVEGDEDQTDIESKNGLTDAVNRLGLLQDVGIVKMDESDIIRSNFTARVLEKYK